MSIEGPSGPGEKLVAGASSSPSGRTGGGGRSRRLARCVRPRVEPAPGSGALHGGRGAALFGEYLEHRGGPIAGRSRCSGGSDWHSSSFRARRDHRAAQTHEVPALASSALTACLASTCSRRFSRWHRTRDSRFGPPSRRCLGRKDARACECSCMFPEWLLLLCGLAIYARISSDREGDGLGCGAADRGLRAAGGAEGLAGRRAVRR